MRNFKVKIFAIKGKWFFRWDNVHVPTVCGLTLPLATQQDAESAMRNFVTTEKRRHWWTVFESDTDGRSTMLAKD